MAKTKKKDETGQASEAAALPSVRRSAVADELRELAKADGRSQAALAVASGIHFVNLSRFLAGKKDLKIESLEALAEALGRQVVVMAAGRRKK